jgi:hypothetical protein
VILTTTVEIYSRTSSLDPNNEGIPKFTFNLELTLGASVQPATLTEAELKSWGISSLTTDSKRVFIPGTYELGQSWAMKDLANSKTYQIRAVNPWPWIHTEMICEPYQGKSPL